MVLCRRNNARMLPPIHYYMDDSGTRTLDHNPTPFDRGRPNHFALGGILVLEEDEPAVDAAHARLCEKWGITYPLHSVDLRAGAKDFSWLRRGSADYEHFMRDLTRMLTTIPVTAVACVIDRPGYDERYRAIYPRSTWHLCRTAFSIAVERAAKHARRLNRALRVYPEKSARADEKRIREYYKALITNGAPFDAQRSQTYAPLSAQQFDETLIELRFRGKSWPCMQVADLYLWPIAMHRYRRGGLPYDAFRRSGRLIEATIGPGEIPSCGTKYSCFELVDRSMR